MLDEQGSQGHAEVFVGLSEAESAQLQLLLSAVNLPRKLVDGAAKGCGQMFTQCRHNAPQHVVMDNPRAEDTKGMGQLRYHEFGLDVNNISRQCNTYAKPK